MLGVEHLFVGLAQLFLVVGRDRRAGEGRLGAGGLDAGGIEPGQRADRSPPLGLHAGLEGSHLAVQPDDVGGE